jgi:hypothetical protein
MQKFGIYFNTMISLIKAEHSVKDPDRGVRYKLSYPFGHHSGCRSGSAAGGGFERLYKIVTEYVVRPFMRADPLNITYLSWTQV